jgi:uncharacterized protein (UPF0335 family)
MARFALAQAGVDQHSHDRLIAQLVHARECRHLGLEAVDLAGARGAREGRTMNPTDLARRWKPYRNAVERAEKAARALQEARARLGQLRSDLGPAEAADSLALGKAILAGQNESPSKVAQIQEEIRAQERRVSALERAHADVQEQIASVIAEHKSSWHRETLSEISKARRRSEDALAELEAARDNLSSIVGLNEWVASGGPRQGSPPTTGSPATARWASARSWWRCWPISST